MAKKFSFFLFTKRPKPAIIFRLTKRTGGSMDRASDSGSEGWGFESLPVYQKDQIPSGIWSFCYIEEEGTRKIQSQYAGGILLQPVQKLVATLIFARPPQGQKCKRVLLRFPVCALPTAGLRCTQTAATRSGRCICPRQRSLRSPFRCTPPSGRLQSLSQPVRLTAPFTQGSL